MEVKIIPALISVILLVIFISPVFMGIFNIGNAFGILVSGSLTGIFVFWKPFVSLIKQLWNNQAGKIFLCIFTATVSICIVIAVIISIFMIRAINDPPKDENTTLVVLGCKVKDGRPSLMLKRRLDASYKYLSEHEAVKVVVSGGQGSDEIISEAQCMRDYLVGKGISPERIFMEDKSTNTSENLEFSKEIIKCEGLSGNITLVTDGFHQCRAEILANKLDINPYNISGYTSWYIVPVYWVREWFGIAYYYIFG